MTRLFTSQLTVLFRTRVQCTNWRNSRGGGITTDNSTSAHMAYENPLALSGLALAGANRAHPSAENNDDGVLTAEEIAGFSLHGTQWALLSACDTGIGEVKAGEGVFGLRRACQIAGARTVTMTLWPVDDEATRAWMLMLYRSRLYDKLDTPASSRAAALAVLTSRGRNRKTTHPFYWAAFVGAGDWH